MLFRKTVLLKGPLRDTTYTTKSRRNTHMSQKRNITPYGAMALKDNWRVNYRGKCATDTVPLCLTPIVRSLGANCRKREGGRTRPTIRNTQRATRVAIGGWREMVSAEKFRRQVRESCVIHVCGAARSHRWISKRCVPSKNVLCSFNTHIFHETKLKSRMRRKMDQYLIIAAGIPGVPMTTPPTTNVKQRIVQDSRENQGRSNAVNFRKVTDQS